MFAGRKDKAIKNVRSSQVYPLEDHKLSVLLMNLNIIYVAFKGLI